MADFTEVVPAPVSVVAAPGVWFRPAADATVTVPAGDEGAALVGEGVAGLLHWPVRHDQQPAAGGVALHLDPTVSADREGYRLDVAADGITVRAATAEGLFRGGQTLRQLLPVDGPPIVPGGQIVDAPRYPYRGVMLDVARHFFDVAAVCRLIDLAALYKVNHLHLHLTDDQGWRIAIDGWPRLAEFGGGTEVGGGPGGFYTKDDFREIVSYAARHFITVVPEIDLPGHTNAALAAYPELSCDGQPRERYTGIEVGFSALCAGNDLTFRFLDDVLGEVAALTPGPYLHIGGDEALTLDHDDYVALVSMAQEIVAAHGKLPVGWHELAAAKPATSTVLQFWGTTAEEPAVVAAAAAGNKVIMSPANRTYLDMTYDAASPVGLNWAGPISVADAYAWDPARLLPGLDPGSVLGVESPLWTETVATRRELEYLAFPRLAVIAEVGWSAAQQRDWASLRTRLSAQAPLWRALGINFAARPDVPWR